MGQIQEKSFESKSHHISVPLHKIVLIQSYWRGYITRKKLRIEILELPREISYKSYQQWADGTELECRWKNKRTCSGKLSKIDGTVVAGNWVDQLAAGKAVFKTTGISVYSGDFKRGVKEGYAQEVWRDGSKYSGFYKNGFKHGFGIYLWSDGSQYVGDWRHNKIEGRGRYLWSDGRKYEGEWLANTMNGQGVHWWDDGRKYAGQYKYNKKHGFGIYTWSNGKQYVGMWVDGKQHGEGTYIYPDGRQKTHTWNMGIQLR